MKKFRRGLAAIIASMMMIQQLPAVSILAEEVSEEETVITETTEEAVIEELAEPAPEEIIVEEEPVPEPVIEEQPAPEPVVEEVPAPEPVVEEPVIEAAPEPEPVVEEPVIEAVPEPEPVVEEPVIEAVPEPEPAVVEEQPAPEPVIEEVSAPEPAAEEPVIEAAPAEEAAVEEVPEVKAEEPAEETETIEIMNADAPEEENKVEEEAEPEAAAEYNVHFSAAEGGTVSASDGSSGSFSKTVKAANELPAVTAIPNDGYTFSMWTRNNAEYSRNETISFEAYADALADNDGFTAVFTPEEQNGEEDDEEAPLNNEPETVMHTVVFMNGDEKIDERTVEDGHAVGTLPAAPSKSGCTFSGWFNAGTQISAETVVSADMNVSAEFEASFYTVNFYGSREDTTTLDSRTYNKGSETITIGTLPEAPAHEGKDFVKWVDQDGADVTEATEVTKDMNIYAVYADQIRVSFMVNDSEYSHRFVSAGDAVGTLPESPFVEGYKFIRWVDAQNNEVTAETIVGEDGLTAYAELKKINIYKIHVEYFYMDNGERKVIDSESFEAEKLPFTHTVPASVKINEEVFYYPTDSTITADAADFAEGEFEVTKTMEYVPFTAEYDFVYMLKKLDGEGYDEIERIAQQGVRGATVTPEVKDYEYAEFERLETAQITEASGQELHVYYTRENFTLSYQTNGGSNVQAVTAAYETEVALSSAVPTRTGYTFAGWYLDEELTEEAGSTVKLVRNTTVYAKWEGAEVNYRIVYMFEKYNDAGTEASYVYDNSESGTAKVGTTVKATDSGIPDKTRKGWEKDTEKNNASETVITADGSSVLYVYYRLKAYTFTFNAGTFASGWSTYNAEATLTGKGVTGTGTLSYTMTVKLGQDISSAWPGEVTGRYYRNNRWRNLDFNGWKPDGSSTRYVTKRTTVAAEMLPNNGTSIGFTAQWTEDAETYVVNYWLQNADDNNYTRSETYSQTYTSSGGTLSAKEISGYTYDHGNSGDPYATTYNFYYNRNTYSIDYMDGARKLDTISGIKFDASITGNRYNWTPAKPAGKEDYTWDGWYTDAGLTAKYTFSKMPASNLVLYAKWVAPQYKVTFDLQGGTAEFPTEQTVEKYQLVQFPGTPVRENYDFDKWTADAAGSTPYDWNTQITKDTTVYAQWKLSTLSYTVHYYEEGTEKSLIPDKTVKSPAFTIGTEITEKPLTITGYRPDKVTETIKLDYKNNVITFYYSKKAEHVSYTVHYVLASDANIKVHESKTVEADPTLVTAIEMAAAVDKAFMSAQGCSADILERDYHPLDDTLELVLSSDESLNVMTFRYADYKTAKVTVNYLDMNGSEIKPSTTANVAVGDKHVADMPAASGFSFHHIIASDGNNSSVRTITSTDPITINIYYQRQLTITAVNKTKAYDGTALRSEGTGDIIWTGLADGHMITAISFTGEQTEAGSSATTPKDAVITGSTENYYRISYISGVLTVTASDVRITIDPDRWNDGPAYDGTERTIGFRHLIAGGTEGVDISNAAYDAKYGAMIREQMKAISLTKVDAGFYTIPASQIRTALQLPEDGAFNIVSIEIRDGELTIAPAELTVKTGSASRAYNGKPLTNDEASLTGLVGKEKATVKATGSRTEAGTSENTYEITWDTAKASNYTIKEELGTLEVTENTDEIIVTITGKNASEAYSGKEQSVEGYDVTISDPAYTEADFSFTGEAKAARTEAGKTEMGLNKDQFANINENFTNVTFEVTDGYMEVTPLAVTVTITGNHDSKVYSGSEQQVEGYEVTEISSDLYTAADFTFSGSAKAARTEAGKTEMGLNKDQFTNNNGSFTVDFSITDGYMEITPVTDVYEITVTGNSDTKVYNGSEQSVAGYTVSEYEASINFTGIAQDDAKATAKGTDAGKYTMAMTAADFTAESKNYSNIQITVKPGVLTITEAEPVTADYKAEHYQQNVNGSGYTLADTENLEGEAGTAVTAKAKTYEGFTLNKKAAGTKESGEIAADGSLVLKLYYDRNTYTVTYSYTGTVPTGASALPAAASYRFGANVTTAPAATAEGYTFSGWNRTGTFRMPAQNVTITGSFTATPVPPGPGPDPIPDPIPEPIPEPVPEPIPAPVPEPIPAPAPAPVIPAPTPVVPAPAPAPEPVAEPEEEPTIIDEPETPMASPEASAAPEVIDDPETPMTSPEISWALINLLCTIATVIAGAGMAVTFLRKKEDDEEETAERTQTEDEEDDENKRRKSKFFGLIPAIASVITFILTENLSGKMILTDRWTLLMVLMLAVNLVIAYLTRNKKQEAEDEEAA